MQPPVIVCNAPRSGSSATMGVLEICGLNLGKRVQANLKENLDVREGVEKHFLRHAGMDPLGQDMTTFGNAHRLNAISPKILRDMLIAAHGQTEGCWGFKIIKGLLFWELLLKAFPDAVYVMLSRPVEDIARSALRTSFLNKYGQDVKQWEKWAHHYVKCMAMLLNEADKAFVYTPFQVRWPALIEMLQEHGVQGLACGPEELKRINQWINPELFHKH